MLFSFCAAVGGGLRSFAFYTLLGIFAIADVVNAADTTVAIGGMPVTRIAAAKYYSFQPWATDSRHKPLRFSISNKPVWAGFDTATGRLFGTPVPVNIGTYRSVVISASDGSTQISLPAFSITVLGLDNHVPLLSGSPPTTVIAGQQYAFQVNAHDPDGDRLAFELYDGPSWLKMDVATGKLVGTPTPADVGIYRNFYVSATDGYARTYLPRFTITVLPAVNPGVRVPVDSAVRLDWEPPTENTDSSALIDLAGYRVYYGTAPESLDHRVEVASPGIASYVVADLSGGTWYFAVSAYNSAGVESEPSNVASSIIPAQ